MTEVTETEQDGKYFYSFPYDPALVRIMHEENGKWHPHEKVWETDHKVEFPSDVKVRSSNIPIVFKPATPAPAPPEGPLLAYVGQLEEIEKALQRLQEVWPFYVVTENPPQVYAGKGPNRIRLDKTAEAHAVKVYHDIGEAWGAVTFLIHDLEMAPKGREVEKE